jgi:tetratricopeptide (TPR) repeat protein
MFPLRIFVVLIAASLTHAQQTDMTAEDWIKSGVQAYKVNRYADAQAAFEKALALSPDNVNAQLNLACTYMIQWIPGVDSPDNLAHFKNAEDQFQKVLGSDPDNKRALAFLSSMEFSSAQAMGGRGADGDKMAALERSRHWNIRRTQLDPNDAEPYYYLGVISWSECFQPIQKQRTAEALKPDDGVPLANSPEKVALQASCSEKLSQGIQDLRRAVELDPGQDDAMAYLNQSYRLKANLADSKQEAAQLVKTAEEWANRSLESKRKKAQQAPKKDEPSN